jgi:hypothetical protein
MKNIIFLTVFVSSTIGFSITSTAQSSGNNDGFYDKCGTTPIFYEAEVMPMPVGGCEKLLKDLNATVKLQKQEKSDFVVDIQMNCSGQTRNIQIRESEFDYRNKEKILAFFRGVKFYPAKQRGHEVNCNFHYQISYKKGVFTEAKVQIPKRLK